KVPRRIVQGPADLAERQAKASKQADPIEASHISVRVEPMSRLAAPGGRQQADFLVIVQRANRQTRGCRQFAAPPPGLGSAHRSHYRRRYDLTSREVQEVFG